MSFPHFLRLVAATALFVPIMLLADSADISQQLALAGATGLFLYLLVRKSSIAGGQVVCAMVIATAGELFLSLVWGLYSYRFAAIPFYVPIGHGVFYALAAESARQEPLRRAQTMIVRAVLIGGTTYALISLAMAGDTWGLLWWIGAALLITHSRSPLLMSTCVVYTILLEWAGTAIGNWRWAEVAPVVGLQSANPPSGVGILYVLLDLFTVMVCSSAWFARLNGRDLSGLYLLKISSRGADNAIKFFLPTTDMVSTIPALDNTINHYRQKETA